MISELIKKNRSYRRYYQEVVLSKKDLIELIELARYSSSAANLQPLRYLISSSEEDNEKVFSTLSWAGYLTDWQGPEEGEKPSAYIAILNKKPVGKYALCDAGIVCQSMLLGAVEKELGGCMFGAVNREKFKELFNIPEDYELLLVLALGKPKEKIVLEDVIDGNIKYYRDEKRVHHVPKRKLAELILNY